MVLHILNRNRYSANQHCSAVMLTGFRRGVYEDPVIRLNIVLGLGSFRSVIGPLVLVLDPDCVGALHDVREKD